MAAPIRDETFQLGVENSLDSIHLIQQTGYIWDWGLGQVLPFRGLSSLIKRTALVRSCFPPEGSCGLASSAWIRRRC